MRAEDAIICHVCGSQHDPHPQDVSGLYLCCPRCLAPRLRIPEVTDEQVERILLSMYGIPTIVDSLGFAIEIVLRLAPTVDVVDQVRSKLHAIDVQVLTEQVRTAERTRLHQ